MVQILSMSLEEDQLQEMRKINKKKKKYKKMFEFSGSLYFFFIHIWDPFQGIKVHALARFQVINES